MAALNNQASDIDKILIRLLADVDDNMEFHGSIFNPDPTDKVKRSLAKAAAQLQDIIRREKLAEIYRLKGTTFDKVDNPVNLLVQDYARGRIQALSKEQP